MLSLLIFFLIPKLVELMPASLNEVHVSLNKKIQKIKHTVLKQIFKKGAERIPKTLNDYLNFNYYPI